MSVTLLRHRGNPHVGFDDVVRLLGTPDTYRHGPQRVDVLETHISCVFLTDRFVYKLKKPVRFDFLDFSTVERRRNACEDEVRLNRRMAPGVYLRVLAVTAIDNRLELAGRGRVVDWVVQMRRLPDERMLPELIRTGKLTSADVARLADTLARFYQQAPPLIVRPAQYRDEIESHVRANREELLSAEHGLPTMLIKRVHAGQLRMLRCMPDLLDARVRDGRIVDGHGDLRPEHVCLIDPPVVFDCIEFSAELRRIDVLDELSFLAMECDRLGAGHVGRAVLEVYCQALGDRPPAPLADFYKAYRACVRAKVAVLRGRQLDGAATAAASNQALTYLHLADDYAARLGPPALVVVRGLSGTGKTTLAGALSEALGAEVLSTDALRRQRHGDGDGSAAYAEGIYGDDQRRQVYESMLKRAAALLEQGLTVILDGTFLTTSSRGEAEVLARRHGAFPLVVQCRCPEEVARQRVASRLRAGQSQSDARPDLLAEQREHEQADPPGAPSLEVDTTKALPAQVSAVLDGLRPF